MPVGEVGVSGRGSVPQVPEHLADQGAVSEKLHRDVPVKTKYRPYVWLKVPSKEESLLTCSYFAEHAGATRD